MDWIVGVKEPTTDFLFQLGITSATLSIIERQRNQREDCAELVRERPERIIVSEKDQR